MYGSWIGSAPVQFLSFKRSKLTKNGKKNLKQNSKARIMKNKKNKRMNFLPVIIPVIGLNYRFHQSLSSVKVSQYFFRVLLKIWHLKVTEIDRGRPGKKFWKRFRVSLCINFSFKMTKIFFHKFSEIFFSKIFIFKSWQIFLWHRLYFWKIR